VVNIGKSGYSVGAVIRWWSPLGLGICAAHALMENKHTLNLSQYLSLDCSTFCIPQPYIVSYIRLAGRKMKPRARARCCQPGWPCLQAGGLLAGADQGQYRGRSTKRSGICQPPNSHPVELLLKPHMGYDLTCAFLRHKLHVDLIISALHPLPILLPVSIHRVEYYLKEQTGLCAWAWVSKSSYPRRRSRERARSWSWRLLGGNQSPQEPQYVSEQSWRASKTYGSCYTRETLRTTIRFDLYRRAIIARVRPQHKHSPSIPAATNRTTPSSLFDPSRKPPVEKQIPWGNEEPNLKHECGHSGWEKSCHTIESG
jgi:hypothetical protein